MTSKRLISAVALACAMAGGVAHAGGYPVVVPASSADNGSRSTVTIDQGGIANEINNANSLATNAQNTAIYAVSVGSNAQTTASNAQSSATSALAVANYAATLGATGNVVGSFDVVLGGNGAGASGICVSGSNYPYVQANGQVYYVQPCPAGSFPITLNSSTGGGGGESGGGAGGGSGGG